MLEYIRKTLRRDTSPNVVYAEHKTTLGSYAQSEFYRYVPAVRMAIDKLADGIGSLDVQTDLDMELLVRGDPKQFLRELATQMFIVGYAIVRVERSAGNGAIRRFEVMRNAHVAFTNFGEPSVSNMTASQFIFIPDSAWVDGAYPSRIETLRTIIHSLDANDKRTAQELKRPDYDFIAAKSSAIMSDEVFEAFAQAVGKATKNTDGKRSLVKLENGLELEKFTSRFVPEEQSMELDDRNMRIVAAMFGVPPHWIGARAELKYANASAAAVGYSRDTVQPIADRISSAFRTKLDVDFVLDTAGLLRGDFKAQIELATRAVERGILTATEARAMFLGMPPNMQLNDRGEGQTANDLRDRTGERHNGGGITDPTQRADADA